MARNVPYDRMIPGTLHLRRAGSGAISGRWQITLVPAASETEIPRVTKDFELTWTGARATSIRNFLQADLDAIRVSLGIDQIVTEE